MSSETGRLARFLVDTWERQASEGFLLVHPDEAAIEERIVHDEASMVDFRFRWMPHRELRTDVAELERRGIINPDRDESILYRDPRDPNGRQCFLCIRNITECNPMEELIFIELAGRAYAAGANFAWIERNHYTVMATEHLDQDFTPHVIDAMLEFFVRTGGEFRVLYNGASAGATIPWHLHFQITTERLPVEMLPPGREAMYPAALQRIEIDGQGTVEAIEAVNEWVDRDPEHHRVNVLVAGTVERPLVHIFARDTRLSHAAVKGLMGGFEVCGDLVYSEPDKRDVFEDASVAVARQALEEVRPRLA